MNPSPVLLCVDDEAVNVRLLEALLEPHGYTVLKAGEGREALALLESHRVDLLLLDVMMPGMSGFEVCRSVKQTERTRHIPVILLTALSGREDRIRGIEAGADDFITKPFDKGEVLARVRMLLNVKGLNERLNAAYEHVLGIIAVGGELIRTFNPLTFDFQSSVDAFAAQTIRGGENDPEKPEVAVVGLPSSGGEWRWKEYRGGASGLAKTPLRLELPAQVTGSADARLLAFGAEDLHRPENAWLPEALRLAGVQAKNAVCYLSPDLCVLLLNFTKAVTAYDAAVLESLVTQSLFLRSLALQVSETENAFAYAIGALARAAEANDEDTGNHILRVGQYCASLAAGLKMPEGFVRAIGVQAQMHDVGKIHVHPGILKKSGALTADEWAEMQKHTLYGAMILGEHPRFALAKSMALSHHEKWDGSGYPFGLKGEEIPVEGRIIAIADQYDALRNRRLYKAAWDHAAATRILTEGDERSSPAHFDPEILTTFQAIHGQFDAIYERLRK